MAKVEMKCPGCGETVFLGDIECPHCGINLKSGESYESRLKQSKGKLKHPEHFLTGGIYAGLILAFGAFTFAGYMYQRAATKVLVARSDIFHYGAALMEDVDGLQHAGKNKEARELSAEIINWLGEEASAIKPPPRFTPVGMEEDYRSGRRSVSYNERMLKTQLLNLKAKAEFQRAQLPLPPPATAMLETGVHVE